MNYHLLQLFSSYFSVIMSLGQFEDFRLKFSAATLVQNYIQCHIFIIRQTRRLQCKEFKSRRCHQNGQLKVCGAQPTMMSSPRHDKDLKMQFHLMTFCRKNRPQINNNDIAYSTTRSQLRSEALRIFKHIYA